MEAGEVRKVGRWDRDCRCRLAANVKCGAKETVRFHLGCDTANDLLMGGVRARRGSTSGCHSSRDQVAVDRQNSVSEH
jgi:hypothetical protein